VSHERYHFSAAAAGMGGKDDPQKHDPRLLVSFGSMYGVDGPFVGDTNKIRGVPGDELPWEIARSARGFLTTSGHLVIAVKGLVFKDDPTVPAELRGTNDEAQFRGLVSCLTEAGDSVAEANVVTPGFAANARGDSFIDARLTLPNPCVAPIAQAPNPGAKTSLLAVKAEHPPNRPPDREQSPHHGRRLRGVERGHQSDQMAEVVRSPRCRQRPYIENMKVRGDLVDSPRARGVFGSAEPI